MKIVCENCHAKYSIADEKVAGKVFKIRCKRCSEVIVVRGDEQQAAPEGDPTRLYDYGPDAIWHVVINGEQQGPFAPAQLAEMLSSGTVDWEAYVWAEGFDNWVPMQDVDDLVAAITGGDQPAAAQGAYAGGAVDSLAAQPSMGADPFADDASAGGGVDLFGDTSGQSGSADLFGAGAPSASPFDAPVSDGVVASSPGPRVSTADAMTGARNENSVLFSLKNLQALATGSSTPSVAPSTGGGGDLGMGAGFASGEGSGLIDIRALASATGVGDSDGGSEKDELLSMGSQTGAFGALGSPMLAPVADDEGDSKKTIIWASVAGVAFLSVAAVAIVYILRPVTPPAASVVAPTEAATATAAAANPQPAAPAADEKAEAPSEGELAAKKEEEPDEDKKEHHTKRRSKSSGSSSSSKSSDSKDDAPAAAAAEPAKKKFDSSNASIDDLLDNALTGGGSKKRSAPAAPKVDSNLPDLPGRDDVVKAMNGVKDEVQACATGQGGVAFANVTVSGSTGRVTNAQISGITGPAGSCIARAVRKASFPKFKQKTFKVKFPFRL